MAKGRRSVRQRQASGQLNKAVNPNFAAMADVSRGTDVKVRPFALLEAIQAATGEVYGPGTFQAMPRDPQDDSAFGPMDPLTPEPIDALNGVGRTDPRAWQYQVGWNLPGNGNREVPWQVLRAASQGVGIIRRCIEVRKKHARGLRWVFGVSEDAIQDAYLLNPGAGKLDAEQKLRERLTPEINRLREFWRKPWKTNDADMGQWINAVLEDYLTLDALAIFPRKTYGGDVHDLEIIDASTIKPLLDHRGTRPLPPHPAFQQVLYGFPRGEWTASAEYDEAGNALVSDTYAASELFYRRENFRSFSPYGYSAVEMALFDARLYLQRQKWMLAEYDDGSTPLTWVETAEAKDGKQMTLTQQRQWERAYNAKVQGQTRERHRIKLLPNGWKATQMSAVDERYKPEYDLHLIKLLASYFGVTIAELGFTEPTGLGNNSWHEGQAEVTGRLGLRPDTEVLTDVVNALSRQFLNMPAELEFSFVDPAAANDLESDQVMNSQRTRGTITVNEERQQLGQSLLPFEEANMHFLTTPTGPIFLQGSYQRAQQAAEAAQMQAQTQALGTAGKLHIEERRLEDGVQARAEQRDCTREQMAAQTEAETNKAAEISAYRNWNRKHPEQEPRRPFLFKHVTPDDGFAELDGIGPWRVQYEGWEWQVFDEITKSAMSWLEWNLKHPTHPRGPNGRWVKAVKGDLVSAIKDQGEKRGRVVDTPSSVQGVKSNFDRRDDEISMSEIRDVYLALVKRSGGRVAISDLRERLTARGMSREQQDNMLRRMASTDQITLTPQEDPKFLTSRDRDAAVDFGGDRNHWISIQAHQQISSQVKTPDNDLVEAARAQQRRVDYARARAGLLAEIQELRYKEAPEDVLTRRMRAHVEREQIEDDPLVGHLTRSMQTELAGGSGLEGAMSTAEAAWGLRRVGTERMVPFDRREQKLMYGRHPEAGTFVHLVRPGYRFKDSSGEDILIERAVVELAEPDEVAEFKARTKRLPDTRPPAALHSSKTLLRNTWGAPRPGQLAYHPDSEIGQAIARLGRANQLQVQGDALGNVLGRIATEGHAGRMTAEQQILRLREVRDELPSGAARTSINGLITRLDAPVVIGGPAYGSVPTSLVNLARELHQVPLARRDRAEIDRLDEIMREVDAGRLRGMRLTQAIRQLGGRRHESQEGAVEIDTAVRRAVDALLAEQRNRRLTKAGEPDDPKAQAQQPEQPPVPPEQPVDARWPGWLLDTVIATAVTALLLEAMPGLDIGDLLDRFFRWARAYRPGDPMPDVRQWITREQPELQERLTALIAPAVRQAHIEGAFVGQRAAEAVVEAVQRGEDARDAISYDVDWEGWTPGHPSAAQALLEPGGLERLLYQSNATINRIATNRLDEIGRVLGEGLSRGDSPETIARTLREQVLDNRAWAHRIAVTETNRAMSYASVMSYRDAGMLFKGWMTATDQRVCLICLTNEFEPDGTPRVVPIDELFPSGDPWPPAHPHCRCAPIPVVRFPRRTQELTEEDVLEKSARSAVMSWLEWNIEHPEHPRSGLGRFTRRAGSRRDGGTRVRPQGTHKTKFKRKISDIVRKGENSRTGDYDPITPSEEKILREGFIGTFAGLDVRDVQIEQEGYETNVYGNIYDPDGSHVGEFWRAYWYDPTNGSTWARHNLLQLYDADLHGQGFAREFNNHLIEWYRESGVKGIELHADIDIGGYAWARAGYDWKDKSAAYSVEMRLRETLTIYDPKTNNATLIDPARQQEQWALGHQMVKRLQGDFDADDFPTPYEVSQLGRWPGAGKDDWWIGKAVMISNMEDRLPGYQLPTWKGWMGVRYLEPA